MIVRNKCKHLFPFSLFFYLFYTQKIKEAPNESKKMHSSLSLIKTERCTISPISENDRDDVMSLKLNNEARKFLGGAVPKDQINDKIDGIISDTQSHHFIVRDIHDKSFIGLVTINIYHDNIRNEISYEFNPEKYGHGFANESISAIIDYALTTLGLENLVAETQSRNIPSIKLLEKLGMIKEQTITRHNEEQSVYTIDKRIQRRFLT